MEAQGRHSFVTFRISGVFYGVDILSVREVNSEFSITSIPHTPASIQGYVNLRGQIHLIIDLAPLLNLKDSTQSDDERRLIIFKEAIGDPFGIIVDEIGDVITVSENQIEEFNFLETRSEQSDISGDQTVMNGICKLETGLMVTIDAKSILPVIQNRVENYESTDR